MKKIKFNGTQLKLIAVFCMLLDHIGYAIFPEVTALRAIGRLAFPIFAFLVAEGMKHTSNWKKYVLRLFVFAIISEIPFDLLTSGKVIDLSSQNVLFTMLFGALAVVSFKTNQNLGYLGAVLAAGLGFVCCVDYGLFGVILILFIYILNKEDVRWGSCVVAVWCLCYGGMELWGVISALFLLRYNKERGWNTPVLKYGFYVFYPLHMLVIYLISTLI